MQFLRSLNLPNRLTLLRVALTPLFFALLLLPIFPFCSGAGARALCRLGAAAVFGAAAITDLFDGRIARARSLVTDFGKFLDPIADKLMVFAAFLRVNGP